MNNLCYAGIGSRDTPNHICDLMFNIGYKLAKRNWTLRSGHARGADRAFEDGCVEASGRKEIFTKKSFVTDASIRIAERFHPVFNKLDTDTRRLMARNGYIILGENVDDPVDVVICYGLGGFEWGGTSQGLRIAKYFQVPIINLFYEDVYKNMKDAYG